MKSCLSLISSITLAASAFAGAHAYAGCPTDEEVLSYVAAYANRQSVAPIKHIKTAMEAYCAQGMVAAAIGRRMGVPAGYKAAYTSDSVQQQSGIKAPIRAFLFEHMFLQDGAVINADFGARPQISADLIAVVKDGHIQDARTPLEVLEHISFVVPYIELSDAMLHESAPVTAFALIATNVGTRYGVLGEPIAVEATSEFLEKLAAMRVVMTDAGGNEIGQAQGKAMSGHPLNSLLWLGADLAYNAQRIQPGDMLGVGAFFPPSAPKAGSSITVQYVGLPGDPSVSVSFEDEKTVAAQR
jgi:2-oxo-hept-3-ene-1,7-dioate hydratase